MSRFCVRCRWPLGRSTGESALYSPHREFTLCEPCFFEEDAQIEAAGTNNLPEQVERYRQNIKLGARP